MRVAWGWRGSGRIAALLGLGCLRGAQTFVSGAFGPASPARHRGHSPATMRPAPAAVALLLALVAAAQASEGGWLLVKAARVGGLRGRRPPGEAASAAPQPMEVAY